MIKQIQEKLEKLIGFLELDGKTEIKIESEENEGTKVYIHIKNEEDGGKLIGYQGKNLRSLQYVLSLICRDSLEKNTRIIIDVNNYREEKKQRLKEQALQAAEVVKETSEEYDMGFMSPFDRRIVHITIEEIKEVITESIGKGIRKRILVKPKE
jgi:spoIIIJ-associated protein